MNRIDQSGVAEAPIGTAAIGRQRPRCGILRDPTEILPLTRAAAQHRSKLPAGTPSCAWRIDEYLGIARRAEKILRNKNRLTDARARVLAGMLSSRARISFKCGNVRYAWRYLKEAKRIHPSRGLQYAYQGRARKVAPLIGVLPTELLVAIDDSCRSFARFIMRKRGVIIGAAGREFDTFNRYFFPVFIT